MNYFYVHNGHEQQGPFDIEELKSQSLKRDTPIWYEGLEDWIVAEKIEELKILFQPIPPPLKKIVSPLFQLSKVFQKALTTIYQRNL